jgi:hypothetical protein
LDHSLWRLSQSTCYISQNGVTRIKYRSGFVVKHRYALLNYITICEAEAELEEGECIDFTTGFSRVTMPRRTRAGSAVHLKVLELEPISATKAGDGFLKIEDHAMAPFLKAPSELAKTPSTG